MSFNWWLVAEVVELGHLCRRERAACLPRVSRGVDAGVALGAVASNECRIYTAPMTTALKSEIKKLARESVREVLDIEMMRLRASLLPYVSEKEQKNIEKLYQKPSGRAVRTVRMRI